MEEGLIQSAGIHIRRKPGIRKNPCLNDQEQRSGQQHDKPLQMIMIIHFSLTSIFKTLIDHANGTYGRKVHFHSQFYRIICGIIAHSSDFFNMLL